MDCISEAGPVRTAQLQVEVQFLCAALINTCGNWAHCPGVQAGGMELAKATC